MKYTVDMAYLLETFRKIVNVPSQVGLENTLNLLLAYVLEG